MAVGETVRVRLTTRKNEAGGLSFGLCSEVACASMLMKGINKYYEMAYDVAIIRSNDLFYGKRGQWALVSGEGACGVPILLATCSSSLMSWRPTERRPTERDVRGGHQAHVRGHQAVALRPGGLAREEPLRRDPRAPGGRQAPAEDVLRPGTHRLPRR